MKVVDKQKALSGGLSAAGGPARRVEFRVFEKRFGERVIPNDHRRRLAFSITESGLLLCQMDCPVSGFLWRGSVSLH